MIISTKLENETIYSSKKNMEDQNRIFFQLKLSKYTNNYKNMVTL